MRFSFSVLPFCVFMKNDAEDSKCQTLPANSSPPEHNGIRDSSSETQSQRTPDGSEDGESGQSRHTGHTALDS